MPLSSNSRELQKNMKWFAIGAQVMADAITLTLGEPAVMGKDTFGEARLNKMNEYAKTMQQYIIKGLTDCEEASYIREDVDRRLAQINKNSFEPWSVRIGVSDKGI